MAFDVWVEEQKEADNCLVREMDGVEPDLET
jgi:hypothetical protein